MRPLRLAIEGFRSYADRAEFDFRDRTLVGVVGPTGSGKSSILDGISFALYGRTASMPGNATKPLIHRWDPVRGTSPGAAKVELWFAIGADTYRIVRSLKPKGSGEQVLERWDALDGTKVETIADKARAISDTVEELTGLDFDAFLRSVLLAQNQFQELLGAAPADAAKVLTGLFGFGLIAEMRSIAKDRLTRAEAALAAAAKARTALEGLRAKAEEARRALETAAAREAALAAVRADIEAAETRLTTAEAAGAEAAERSRRLAELGGSLPSGEDVAEAVAEATNHEQLLAAATDAAATARAELAAADEALDAALAAGVPDTLARLDGAITDLAARTASLEQARHAVDATELALAAAATARDRASLAVDAAKKNEADASEAAADASAALRAAEAAHAAHLLASGLEPGAPCPVCAQTVDRVPELADPTGLDEAKEAATLATERADAAAIARQRAEHELVGATSKLEAAQVQAAAAADRVSTVSGDVERVESVVADLVAQAGGDPGDPSAALEAGRASFARLGTAKQAAAQRLQRAEAAVDALVGSSAGSTVTELWEAHRSVAAEIGFEPEPWDEATGAGAAMDAIREALAVAVGEAEGSRASAASAVEAATADRAGLLDAIGLAPGDDYLTALAAAGEARAGATAKLEVLDDEVAAGARALAEAEQTAEAALRLQRLHEDLAPGKFPQYLIDEKRHELAIAGSDWFRRLSSGRYEFSLADNRFKVRELTAAGLVRDAETLSGGETFIASLSLALGLASIVGLDQGTAQAFFIDEGFGSLDADSLDLAMEGIEQLVSEDGDRLVVVVSHVPEMRARIEDLVVLNKDPVTGATSVVRG